MNRSLSSKLPLSTFSRTVGTEDICDLDDQDCLGDNRSIYHVSTPLFHPSISSRAIFLVVCCWRLLTPGASRIKNSWGSRCELDILLHHRLQNLETIDLRVIIHVGVLGRGRVRRNHCPAVRLGTIAGASRAVTKFWGPGPVANFWGIDHEQVAEHAASTTIIRDLLSPVSQGKLDIWGNL